MTRALLAVGPLAALLVGGCNEIVGIRAHALVDASIDSTPSAEANGDDTAPGGACGKPGVGIESRVGTPSWTSRSWGVYLGPLGDSQSSWTGIWGPKHLPDPQFGLYKSVVSHGPPYDDELITGLTRAGFTNTGCIDTANLPYPSEVLFSLVLVPSATAPSDDSFDVAAPSPVIEEGTLVVNILILRDQTTVDQFEQIVPAATAVYASSPAFESGHGGYTHLVLNWVSSLLSFEAGSYEVRVAILAQEGSSSIQSAFFVMQ